MSKGLTRRNFLLTGGALAGSCALGFTSIGRAAQAGSSSGASGWQPSQQVRVIDPFAAGGGSDVFGRAMAKGMRNEQNINIVVNNRPGGNGAIGYSYLLSKKGNPNYLLASETAAGLVLPIVQDVPYNWHKYTPIAQAAEDSTMIVVPAGSPFKSLRDFIKAAKNQQVSVGTSGKYGTDTICFQLISQSQDVHFNRVSFESGGKINSALLGNHIDAAGSNPSESVEQIKAGKIRPLAVFREKRFKNGILADVPTVSEQGVDVDVTPTLQYRGPFAAGGITDAQATYWENAVVDWSKSDGYKNYIKTNYLAPTVRTGQDFADFLQKQENSLRSVLKKMNAI